MTETPASYLTPTQIEQLLKPINARRVSKDGKGFSHVEAYDVRAHLTRIFGFGRWSEEVIEQVVAFEDSHQDGSKTKWNVGYRTVVKLTVNAPDGTVLATYTEGAFGDVSNYPSRGDAHDMALKTSQSQALKRCAVNLGDQFGLSLYNRGSTVELVKVSLVGPAVPTEEAESVDEHIEELAPENESDERAELLREIGELADAHVISRERVALLFSEMHDGRHIKAGTPEELRACLVELTAFIAANEKKAS